MTVPNVGEVLVGVGHGEPLGAERVEKQIVGKSVYWKTARQ